MPRQPSTHTAGSEGLASWPPSPAVRCSPVADATPYADSGEGRSLGFCCCVKFFCNAGVAQSNSNNCWSHYEGTRTAVLLCNDGRSGLSRVSKMNRPGDGFDKQQGCSKRGSRLTGLEVWGKEGKGLENQTYPPHPWSARCHLGTVCHSPDGSPICKSSHQPALKV